MVGLCMSMMGVWEIRCCSRTCRVVILTDEFRLRLLLTLTFNVVFAMPKLWL